MSDLLKIEPALLQRIAEGEEAAFTILLRRVIPSLEKVVGKVVKSPEATRDILQETFIRIWINRDKLPDIESPLPWMKRVALNETFTWLSRQAAYSQRLTSLDDDIAAATNTAPDNISLRETEQMLQQAITRLPKQRRVIYEMSRVHGMKSHEIAEELQLSHGYVKNALTAALASLREWLRNAGKMLCCW